MDELEEREGADFGAQCLFAASSTERLHSEDEVEDGAQLFLSSLEDERLLALLPDPVRMLVNPVTLVDVVLDLDRPPVVHERSPHGKLRKRILDSCPILTQQDLDSVYRHELLSGRWTPDDRSGVSGTLHRVSRLLDPYDGGSLIGLTLRMAHPIYGLTRAAPQLQQVIEAGRSLLVLGPPGCGKTTLLREIARVLDVELNRRVFVVDTSSEICGFGRSAHVAVGGTTRRMQVANRKEQHEDMLKAVQNHTPEVVVIDEIGSPEEVQAAGLIGFKGVSLVATAHANSLQEAMKNPGLQPLFGGLEKSTVSDQTAQRSGGRKFVEQRRAEPVFQSLVEVGPEAWVVHEELAASVDKILARQPPSTSRVQAPCCPLPMEQRSGSGARLSRPTNGGARPATAPTAPCRSLATEDIEARRSRREREVSGRAYRLRFDGGVDGGDNGAGPGGAGAILEHLRPVTGRADRRSARKWMLFVPGSCPELMEYAGLFIGLCGVKEALEDLQPPPAVLFVEGDCKFVIDRHCLGTGSGARGAEGLREEHPDVAEKLEQLACRVDEVLQALQRQLLVEVKWRRRARNKAADKLSHEARTHKRSTAVVDESMAFLLRPFNMCHINAPHPTLCMTEGHHVQHPWREFGYDASVRKTIDSPAAKVCQVLHQVEKSDKRDKLVGMIDSWMKHPLRIGEEQLIVFTNTKNMAKDLDEMIRRKEVAKVRAVHGDLDKPKRQSDLALFKEGKIDVLLATDGAARGVDISNVSCVVNFDLPKEPAIYLNRIGHAGKFGHCGLALSFVTLEGGWWMDAEEMLRELPTFMEEAPSTVVPDWLLERCNTLTTSP
eukprot:s3_g23.t2